ncbi:BAG family molecular chaperone regulator, partial [Klebsiella pneumoniae]|uniref:BAG family molecular chaperone regulator n=1 Tax=Klebsiella pneumoniae TaxID=573 RepID=UPI003013F202
YDGTKVAERDINFLLEMLERQLLKLDNIKAEGEGKVQRKMEVCRVQSLLDTADDLKKRNSRPNSNSSDAVSATTNCETSEPDVGTL